MVKIRLIIIFSLFHSGLIFAGPNEAKQVFNKLVAVIGNSSVPKPNLLIMDNATLVAKTFPSGEVMVGKQFLKNCSKFGSDSMNALACVLSHELVHYYQKHFWAQNFGSAYVDSDWGKKIAEDEDSRKHLDLYETQADQLGFYYAFSAGFKTWKVAQPLLDSIYNWYKLRPDLTGYPTLTQRKEIAQTSSSKFAELIPVFEMSNILKVIASNYQGDQQAALIDFSVYGYEHLISSNIQTAEIYNNIAVSKILGAQKYSHTTFAGLQLPVILDQNSLMYEASGSKGNDEDQEKFVSLMNEALESLEKSLKLDDTYWPASVNKSIVLLGLEKFGSCEDELNSKAIRNNSKTNKSIDLTVSEIKGILYYQKGDAIKGKSFFASAKKGGSASAKTNEIILLDGTPQTTAIANEKHSASDTIEKWNGKLVFKGLKSYRTKTDHVISYNNTKAVLLVDSVSGYKIFEFKQKIGFCAVQYVKVAVNYEAGSVSSRGLRIGSSMNEVNSQYGIASSKTSGTVYNYLLYPNQNMVIKINNFTNKVDGWFYYMLE